MPYIKQEDRESIEPFIKMLLMGTYSDGELNYIITKLLLSQLEKRGLNYQNCNNLMGVLTCCQLEMYRQLIGPYEDTKINSNGDVGYIGFPKS